MKKKVMMMVAMLCATVMLVPNVHALKTENECKTNSGSVKDYTSKDTFVGETGADPINLNPTIEYSDDCKTITVKYDAEVISKALKILNEADEAERNEKAAWIGIQYTPKDASTKYYIRTVGAESKAYEANEANYVQPKYVPVNYESLMNALTNNGMITRSYEISYTDNASETTEPDVTITVQINSQKLTVKDPDNVLENEVTADENGNIWSEEIYTEEAEKLAAANKPTPTAKPVAKEDNPDTSDINVAMLLVMMAFGACGFGYMTKKRLS